MKLCKVLILLEVLFSAPMFSQTTISGKGLLDSIQKLNEVAVVATKHHKQDVLGQKTIVVSEAEVVKNPTNFTELLRYNSPIAFKDYGNGGTSSARFRGTSATNTVVLWNGININSVGNGQTDFNAISANTTDQIIVKSGGGSVQYGSGAIGGTVHLNDILGFKKHRDFQVFSSYGSFNTTSNFFKSNLGTGKWAVKLASTFNKSDNDYKFIDDRYTDEDGNLLKNENGNYVNYGLDFSVGYKITSLNKLFFYSSGYYGDRLFSAGLPNPSSGSERNEDFSQRNLLKWEYRFSNFKQVLNLAYLFQEYRYYDNKDSEEFDFGNSKRFLLDYSLKYRFSNSWNITYLMQYENTEGDTNLIAPETRTSFSLGGILTFKPTENFITTYSIRNENNSDFEVPVSMSLSAEQKVLKYVWLKTNLSTNYRVPTFNEMYWPVVGNKNLIPEQSKQVDFGFELENKGFEFSTTVFYIHIDDKIIWLPAGGSNLWAPKNIKEVINKGAEFFLGYTKEVGKHTIHFSGNYTYTQAHNTETGKELPYTPKHLLNYTAEYGYDWFKVYFQRLYQTKVYTNEINIDFYSLDPVSVSNIGLDFKLLEKENKSLVLGAKVNNVLNEVYYFTNLRPMPGRNFNIHINYKF